MDLIFGRLIRGKERTSPVEGGHSHYMTLTGMDPETGIAYRLQVDPKAPLAEMEKLSAGKSVSLMVRLFQRPCKREKRNGELYDTQLFEPVVFGIAKAAA